MLMGADWVNELVLAFFQILLVLGVLKSVSSLERC